LQAKVIGGVPRDYGKDNRRGVGSVWRFTAAACAAGGADPDALTAWRKGASRPACLRGLGVKRGRAMPPGFCHVHRNGHAAR